MLRTLWFQTVLGFILAAMLASLFLYLQQDVAKVVQAEEPQAIIQAAPLKPTPIIKVIPAKIVVPSPIINQKKTPKELEKLAIKPKVDTKTQKTEAKPQEKPKPAAIVSKPSIKIDAAEQALIDSLELEQKLHKIQADIANKSYKTARQSLQNLRKQYQNTQYAPLIESVAQELSQ